MECSYGQRGDKIFGEISVVPGRIKNEIVLAVYRKEEGKTTSKWRVKEQEKSRGTPASRWRRTVLFLITRSRINLERHANAVASWSSGCCFFHSHFPAVLICTPVSTTSHPPSSRALSHSFSFTKFLLSNRVRTDEFFSQPSLVIYQCVR